jgi:hypothetical protein
MLGLSNILSVFGSKKADLAAIKQKLQSPNAEGTLSDDELIAYIDDIKQRVKQMVKDLKSVYSKYGITFVKFKSMDDACVSLRACIKAGTEEAYNNLIKLETEVTVEQKRHLALIRMAVTQDGKRVIDQITRNPDHKQIFENVFGHRDFSGKDSTDGMYQRLWSEIHRLSEYILLQKNKVYH